jgi:hypothetical protein
MKRILQKQLQKVLSHYEALEAYRTFVEEMGFDFSIEAFDELDTPQRAVLEAYLKRFASLQDFLGAKVFRSLLDVSGISYTKMSEVLTLIEKEGIIDLDTWIEFRNIRNNLEHDYPDELEDALRDVKYCVDRFAYMYDVVKKVLAFAEKYDAAP